MAVTSDPLKLPDYRVPLRSTAFPVVDASDYEPYSWTGRPLTSDGAVRVPVVGSRGMTAFHTAFPAPAPRFFGAKGRVVRLPKLLVIRNGTGTPYVLSASLKTDLDKAGVDVLDSGFNLTETKVLGTMCPGHRRTQILTIPFDADAVNFSYQYTRFVGSLPVTQTFLNELDPSVPGFDPNAIAPGESIVIANFTTHTAAPTPSQQGNTAVVTLPDRYIGGELLTLESVAFPLYAPVMAYTVVQESPNIVLDEFGVPKIRNPPLQVTIYQQTTLMDPDRKLVRDAHPRFGRAEWNIFLGKVAESLLYSPATDAKIKAAMIGNVQAVCDGLPGVKFQNVGDVPNVIDPAVAEGIIRNFFGL